MRPMYPDQTPDQEDQTPDQDQGTTSGWNTQPNDPWQPTAPIRPKTIEDQPVQPIPVEPVRRAPGFTLVSRGALLVWLLLGIVEALLILRVLFKALAANSAAGFVQLVYNASAPLVIPFRGIFATPEHAGNVLELSSLVAIVVYGLVALGLVWLLAILNPRPEQTPV